MIVLSIINTILSVNLVTKLIWGYNDYYRLKFSTIISNIDF